ncbi:MAG: internalization-like protein competence protein ComEC/Rec2, competence protein ComEC protein [Parcubacteria group bacterium]|nr:internalization-like protein competence protein ComEC/Rec2, competence protein ComEC protein [Parcubacteria group bacterium]
MANDTSGKTWAYGLSVALLLVVNLVIGAVLFLPRHDALRVSFLNIGQGDSTFIEGPTGIKILVDGGPNRSVLRELSKQLLPWDKHFNLLVSTHPDKDHISGLADVFERFKVDTFLEPGIPDTTKVSQHVFEDAAKEPGMRHVIAKRGMRLHLGGGAYADVLFPDRDESTQTATNDGSVVLHVVYGATSFMLTGDLPSPYEDYLVGLDGNDGELQSDVLKAGHHGSRFSSDSLWLAAVHPRIVVISAGKGNSYGHPNPDTLDRIKAEGARIRSTIDSGTISFSSDGVTVSER